MRGGPARNLSPRSEPELAADLFDVTLGGAFGDDQPLRDLAVRHPLGDERGDLAFAPGESAGAIHFRPILGARTRPPRNRYRNQVPGRAFPRMPEGSDRGMVRSAKKSDGGSK